MSSLPYGSTYFFIGPRQIWAPIYGCPSLLLLFISAGEITQVWVPCDSGNVSPQLPIQTATTSQLMLQIYDCNKRTNNAGKVPKKNDKQSGRRCAKRKDLKNARHLINVWSGGETKEKGHMRGFEKPLTHNLYSGGYVYHYQGSFRDTGESKNTTNKQLCRRVPMFRPRALFALLWWQWCIYRLC